MHRVSAKHRALRRLIADLDARDPSLANLPLSAVNQLTAPLVGSGAYSGTQPSSSSNPQPSPPGGGNGKGHGNGNGNGNGGGNGKDGGQGSDGGSTPVLPPSSTSGGGPAVTPTSIVPTPASQNPVPGQPSGSSRASNASTKSSNTGGGAALLGATGRQTTLGSVASVPSMALTAPSASSPSLSPSDSPLNSIPNTAGIITPSPTTSAATAVSSRNLLSGGAIAGITILCLLCLVSLILLAVRRRSIARRLELRKRWWFRRSTLGDDSSSGNGQFPSPVGLNGRTSSSRQSARSSFATNFDHGLMFHINSHSRLSLDLLPDLPHMAKVHERNSVLISTGGSVARRESMNSILSNGSDLDAQYLTVSMGQNNLGPSTPMSVRPFSPSETFAFPKPPPPSTVDPFVISGTPGPASPQSSVTTLVHITAPPRAFTTDISSAPIATSFHHQTSTPSFALSQFPAASSPSVDPFADPVKPEFSDIEVIRRPFMPTLDDELAVRPGDLVHIFQIFDDGWAFVENISNIASERHERGLIPVDCFRDVDQALLSFLAEKRVSYGSDRKVATAL